jgi:hypothetical protein
MQLLCFVKRMACIYLGGVALFKADLPCVLGELFVVFELWFGGLCSLCELVVALVVLSCCPCLRDRDLSSSNDLVLSLSFGF